MSYSPTTEFPARSKPAADYPSATDRLIVALDFPSAAPALALVDRLGEACLWFKVGMELYYAAGPQILEELRERGRKVFLDLKICDIPNTAAGAVRSLASSGAGLLTVHGSGGAAMLRAAAEAASGPEAPRLLAVTVLTSMDREQLAGIGVEASPAEQVRRLARLAWEAGIRGLVCSPEEVRMLREELGTEALLVVPGIRPAGSAVGDQKRVASPGDAIRAGASMLVVGRPITQAGDPVTAAKDVLAEIEAAIL